VTPASTQWFDSDYGRTADEYNHWYYIDTQPGQSGSPVWVYYSDTDSRYIVTVHAYSDDGSGSNHGTRLNQDKFDRIITWCNSDLPPTDYADLIDDGQAYSGFTPSTVTRGQTSFQAWCDIRNIGTASSGGFYVSYYASTNTVISTSDYFIGSDYLSSVSPFTWADAGWSGTFPSSVPAGEYWVGWIIDGENYVTEFDEGNNTAYKDSYKLTVLNPTTTTTTTPTTTTTVPTTTTTFPTTTTTLPTTTTTVPTTTTTAVGSCIVPCESNESGQINIVETSGISGSQVEVTVEINSAPNLVDALGFEVIYNANCLEYTGIWQRGSCVVNWSFVDVTNPAPGVLRVGGFTTSDPVQPGESCDVVILTFDIITPDLDDPSEAVRLDLQSLVDDLAGWSTSPGYICGGCGCDVNGDGNCTPQDALCSFQKYLGICPTACGACEDICCDVTGDGNCTPADALCRFQEYLGIHPNCFD
jgi:hypothetical protein